ncbi:MAG: hypothetical protein KY476_25400 [Planctomycetes bacterium]|nr:hypothetical protein [Planctomycetota bacterium]
MPYDIRSRNHRPDFGDRGPPACGRSGTPPTGSSLAGSAARVSRELGPQDFAIDEHTFRLPEEYLLEDDERIYRDWIVLGHLGREPGRMPLTADPEEFTLARIEGDEVASHLGPAGVAWWLVGTLETRDVPDSSRRACRSVLTQDFDGRMGNTDTAYSAVVFNPVPGPPMGKQPRLAFRYKLHGTDKLRVQLFSLSNGYHRYLSVHDLPQDTWQSAAVDMRAMRRSDGSGGPLSEDEHIDDIQFYVDPRGEVLIDDIVLYEAAPADEARPFPRRFLFTGWFDTGEQGREWPGTFEIVPHEKPQTWDAARAVVNPETGRPELRIGLRGPRRLEERVRLRFRYRLSAGMRLDARLVDSHTGAAYAATAADLTKGDWSETSLEFAIPERSRDEHVDEIHLAADKGAELLIDDLLLYVPDS